MICLCQSFSAVGDVITNGIRHARATIAGRTVDKYQGFGGNQLCYPLDGDLASGQRYPPIEQLGPEVFFSLFFQASEVRRVGSEEHEAQATEEVIIFLRLPPSRVSRASRPLAQQKVTSKAETRAVMLLCNKNGSNGRHSVKLKICIKHERFSSI